MQNPPVSKEEASALVQATPDIYACSVSSYRAHGRGLILFEVVGDSINWCYIPQKHLLKHLPCPKLRTTARGVLSIYNPEVDVAIATVRDKWAFVLVPASPHQKPVQELGQGRAVYSS